MGYSKADAEAMTDRELAQAVIAYAFPFTYEVLGAEFARRFPQIEAIRAQAEEIAAADHRRRSEEGTLPPMMDWLSTVPDAAVNGEREYQVQVRAVAEGREHA